MRSQWPSFQQRHSDPLYSLLHDLYSIASDPGPGAVGGVIWGSHLLIKVREWKSQTLFMCLSMLCLTASSMGYSGAEHQLPQYIKTFKRREETKRVVHSECATKKHHIAAVSESSLQQISDEMPLNDEHIFFVQKLLQQQFPIFNGLQSPLLSQKNGFCPAWEYPDSSPHRTISLGVLLFNRWQHPAVRQQVQGRWFVILTSGTARADLQDMHHKGGEWRG